MISITLTEEEILGKSSEDLDLLVREKMNLAKEGYQRVVSTLPDQKSIDKILAKLRRPSHKDLISRMMKISVEQTEYLVKFLLEKDLIQEYTGAKDFYVVKN